MAKSSRSYDPFAELCAEMNEVASGCVQMWEDTIRSEPKFRISTGSNLLDLVLGGGLPSGRVVEVYGWPGVGKSTMFSHVCASTQAMGGYCLYIDAENSVCQDRDARIGVSPERYFYGSVETVEEGFRLIQAFLEKIMTIPAKYKAQAKDAESAADKKYFQDKASKASNVPAVIIWDTIAASSTEAELSIKDKGVGIADKARVVRRGLRELSNKLVDNNVLLVFGNHLIENIKGYQPETSCGHAIKFWASARLELKKIGKFLMKDREVGLYVKCKVKKSKLSPPGYEIVYPLDFMDGIDRIYEAFDYLYASKCGVITQKGAWYRINGYPEEGKELALYYADLKDQAKNDPELVKYLLTRMREVFHGLYQPIKK